MAQQEQAKTFMVEDAQIIFRNFAGREGLFNTEGSRNFCVILDQKTAQEMIKDDWNVRYLPAREDGEEEVPYIPVAVNFKNWPPRVVMMTSRKKLNLGEDEVDVLDWANIEKVDLICRAYAWKVGDKSGIKAYLKSLFVTIEEDFLERKYAINEPEE